MSNYNKELFDCVRTVTPEESVHELISAVILRGVLDYRDEVAKCVVNDDGWWYVQESATMKDIERFFNDVNFTHYPRVRDGVLEFMKKVRTSTVPLTEDESESLFKCPICNGDVTGKISKVRVHAAGKSFEKYKKYHCSGCSFSTLLPLDQKENTNEERKVS